MILTDSIINRQEMEQVLIEQMEETLANLISKPATIRYAWGNENLKTWFITKSAKEVLPCGSRLLFILVCEPTNKPISISDTYPRAGDIISDVSGEHLQITEVNWI